MATAVGARSARRATTIGVTAVAGAGIGLVFRHEAGLAVGAGMVAAMLTALAQQTLP